MIKSRLGWGLSVVCLTASAAACATVKPVSTSPGTISTIVAATMRAITAQAPTAIPITPTLTPVAATSTPVPTTIPAARVSFLHGATTGVVSGPISPGQTLAYVLQAGQGQPMLVHIDSAQNDVTLSIKTQGGTALLAAEARQSFWQGTLPQTEDYVLTLYGGAETQQFTLTIQIASRIKFAIGADSIKINGVTTGGYSVTYVWFALKGQKMDVAVYGAGGNPALAIWGYADGKTYLNPAANKGHFAFTIPATQDYILEVAPPSGKDLSYVIILKIK